MEDYRDAILDIGETVATMNYAELASSLMDLKTMRASKEEIAAIESIFLKRAKELGMGQEVKKVIQTIREEIPLPPPGLDTMLAVDARGNPLCTIENIVWILEHDESFLSARYNDLICAAELGEDGYRRRWTDTDTAYAAQILETEYGLYSPQKLREALRLFFENRRMHPIREKLKRITWDGTPRLEEFLPRWMKCEDTPYTREVSRLIFAGGIRRLYEPGCKFDTVPVLTGAQGSGKSTIVRWLALQDEWFAEVTELEGRESIEQLTGAWVSEIAELLALTRVKEQEAVKSFLSRQRDRYRKPYDRELTELPRQCIFIGTTNRLQFLRDRTGNRRFCPVEVHSSGTELYAQEKECRAYIALCWAEARIRYHEGNLSPVADPKLTETFEAAQEEAMEGDWRVGALENYVWLLPEGHYLCVREAARNGLVLGNDNPRDPTPAESREIAQILDRIPQLERAGRRSVAPCMEKAGASQSVTAHSRLIPAIFLVISTF